MVCNSVMCSQKVEGNEDRALSVNDISSNEKELVKMVRRFASIPDHETTSQFGMPYDPSDSSKSGASYPSTEHKNRHMFDEAVRRTSIPGT